MNDDKDMPLNPVGDDALEARIVAWVLGEASSFEAEELERLCAADPALRLFERRMRVLHGLIAEDVKAGPDPEWQLPESKREKVAALFAEPVSEDEEKDAVVPIRRNRTGRRALLALAACTVVSLTAWSVFQQVGTSRNGSVASLPEAPEAKATRSREATELKLEALRKAVIQQEDAVEDKRKLLSQIIRTEGVIYSGDRNAFHGARGFSAADDAESAARAYAQVDQEKIQLESQLETLQKYDGARAMNYASGIALPDNIIPQLLPQYQEAKVQYEAMKSSGVGEDHPDMKSRASRLSSMEDNLTEATANLKETLKTRLDLAKEQSARLKTRIDSKEDDAIKQGIANQSFADAKLDFESNMRQLEDLKIKLITEEMQAKIPEDALATNDKPDFLPGGGGGAGKAKPASEPMIRAKQEAAKTTDLQSLALNEPESPAAPPPAAMPAQRPAAAEKAESELLAKRQQQPADFDRAPAGPEVATRFGADAPMAGKPATTPAEPGFRSTVDKLHIPGIPEASDVNVSEIVTAGNRSGDGAIDRNNIDAVLNNPNRAAGGNSAPGIATFTGVFSDEAVKSISARMMRNGEGETKSIVREAKPGETAVADGFFAGGAVGRDFLADTASGGLAKDLSKDLKPSESRDKSESFAFGNLEQMGELAQKLPTDQSRFRMNLRLGSERSLAQQGYPEVEVYDFEGFVPKQAKPGIEVVREYPYSDRELQEKPVDLSSAAVLGAEGFNEAPLAQESKETAAVTGLADAATMIEEGESLPLKWTEGVNLTWDDKAGAKPLQENLDDPIRTNPAHPYEHTENVDKIRRNLYTAEGHYNLGKYDEAKAAYEEALRIDPYNKAARRGLEQVAQAGADYYRASYDQTRAQLLVEVDKAWELSVPPVTPAEPVNLTELRDLIDRKPTPLTPSAKSHLHLREVRKGAIDRFHALLGEAREAYSKGSYPEAYRKYIETLEVLPDEPFAKERRDFVHLSLQDTTVALASVAEKLGDKELSAKWREKGREWEPVKPEPKQAALDLMAETATAAEPFSTFSLHVSDASFKLAKAAMERGEIPAADSIRPEEFYNAFDYGDPSPANGEPVVCAVEQSAHPAFPQRNLLRVGIKTGSQGRGQATPLNLTLLLDSSGSMEREDRSAGLANAVRQLSGLLKEGDTITVAGFSRQPRLLADRLPGARAEELNGLIARTPSEGGTNLEEGLKLAEELAKRQFNPVAQNRIVLFTDGAANLGDARPEALQARVEGLRQQGIAFDAAGFGAEGLNDKLLERLTRNGNGRYYIVDRAEDADAGFAKQLAGAFRPAAENVKVQVRFNPARVAKYKLIGFEEHRLKKEDFRNDAVDAAEMAAEEAGNALYQIEVLPQGEGEVGEVSTRFRDAASGQMVERTWTIPYESQAPAFDQAKPAIQLAGLAAFAAEKLRGAPMADAIDLQQLAPVLAKVKARYANSQPVADLESMIGKLK